MSRASSSRTMATSWLRSMVKFILHSAPAGIRAAARCARGDRPVVARANAADLPRQLRPAAVDPRLYRALGQPQRVGDLLIRQLLDVPHHHRLTQRRRQFLQRRAAAAAAGRAARAPRTGSSVARHRRQLAGIDVAVDRLALLADAAVVIDAQVAADADQPGLEVGAAVEGVERLEDLDEDVLRQVLGVVVLPVNL